LIIIKGRKGEGDARPIHIYLNGAISKSQKLLAKSTFKEHIAKSAATTKKNLTCLSSISKLVQPMHMYSPNSP